MEIQEKLTRIRTLPLLPMRGVVVFPHTALHFDVGRPKSLRALNEAMGRDQYLFLSTQKDMTVDDPDSGGMSPGQRQAGIYQRRADCRRQQNLGAQYRRPWPAFGDGRDIDQPDV